MLVTCFGIKFQIAVLRLKEEFSDATICVGLLKEFPQILKEKSGLWGTILSQLERNGMFGEGIPLQCKNHPSNVVFAKTEKDFLEVPEGKPALSL